MPLSQLVMLDCLLAWHSAYSTDSATEIPVLNTSEIRLRIEVQSQNRCTIQSWCQQMTYRKPPKRVRLTYVLNSDLTWLEASCSIDWLGHLWHSVTEKSKIALASYGRPTLPKLSPYYYVLHFALSWEAPQKVGGGGERHSKKNFFRRSVSRNSCSHFWNAPSVTGHSQSKLCPPVKIWQIQPCLRLYSLVKCPSP